jgi:hypothetical protein
MVAARMLVAAARDIGSHDDGSSRRQFFEEP